MTTNSLEQEKQHEDHPGQFYTVVIDDVEYRLDHTPATARELMDLAGIPYATGMVLIADDGTQTQVGLDDVFDLQPGRRFKKRPQFKRG